MLSLFTCIKNYRWVLLLSTLWISQGYAISFESLLMPGKVIEGHVKYEDKCEKCHNDFDKTKQKDRCIACHEKIADDLKQKKGFHGKSKEVGTTECKVCHTEHKGRDAKVVHLDKERFDHKLTDFELTGAHKTASCGLCHKEGKLYREAPSACNDCHKDNDVHKGKMGKKCQDCHKTDNWTKNEFDHDKTKFKLKQAHKKVMCDSCHPNQRYKDVPKTCNACHQSNDVHSGNMGNKCEECHTENKWKESKFNHDKKTKFALKGAHKKASCASCHKKPAKQEKKAGRLGKECIDCHKLDDVHSGRNGKDCKKCHNSERWSDSEFDHDKKTKFPLTGAHKEQACHVCHRAEPGKEKLKKDCKSCHKAEDVHQGELGDKCQSCHNTSKWNEKIFFDHDISRFPLIGQHALAPCEACHLEQKYKDTTQKCNDCHKDDDVHKGNFEDRCDVCHNPNDWMLWYFNHDTQTDFKLEDAHKNLQCKSCHTRSIHETKKEKRNCYTCHRADDIHNGDFGKDCERCHNTNKFIEYKIDY